MERIFEYKTSEYIGATVRDLLKSQGYSRHLLTGLKKTDSSIKIIEPATDNPEGSSVYLNHRLSGNEIIKVTLKDNASSEHIIPVKLPLNIVYEDEDILVINKPADMPIHPSINNHDNTLANAVSYYYDSKGEDFVYRCITRLDRDTTGLVLIGKNLLSASILSEMMLNKSIKKTYHAICEGIVEGNGIINAPIARKSDSTIERTVDYENGESAITEYQSVKSAYICDGGKCPVYYSLIKINLLTGRTHQIRVHFKHIGHPLIGDFLYNPDSCTNAAIKRQALHCSRLELIHPIE